MGRDDPEPPRHSHAAVESFLRVGDLFHGYHSHSSFVKELDFNLLFLQEPQIWTYPITYMKLSAVVLAVPRPISLSYMFGCQPSLSWPSHLSSPPTPLSCTHRVLGTVRKAFTSVLNGSLMSKFKWLYPKYFYENQNEFSFPGIYLRVFGMSQELKGHSKFIQILVAIIKLFMS